MNDKTFRDVVIKGFHLIHAYSGNQKMSEKCFWLLLRMPELASAKNMADIANQCHATKQAVSKCILLFQESIPELPALETQRTAAAREEMSRARIEQLK